MRFLAICLGIRRDPLSIQSIDSGSLRIPSNRLDFLSLAVSKPKADECEKSFPSGRGRVGNFSFYHDSRCSFLLLVLSLLLLLLVVSLLRLLRLHLLRLLLVSLLLVVLWLLLMTRLLVSLLVLRLLVLITSLLLTVTRLTVLLTVALLVVVPRVLVLVRCSRNFSSIYINVELFNFVDDVQNFLQKKRILWFCNAWGTRIKIVEGASA